MNKPGKQLPTAWRRVSAVISVCLLGLVVVSRFSINLHPTPATAAAGRRSQWSKPENTLRRRQLSKVDLARQNVPPAPKPRQPKVGASPRMNLLSPISALPIPPSRRMTPVASSYRRVLEAAMGQLLPSIVSLHCGQVIAVGELSGGLTSFVNQSYVTAMQASGSSVVCSGHGGGTVQHKTGSNSRFSILIPRDDNGTSVVDSRLGRNERLAPLYGVLVVAAQEDVVALLDAFPVVPDVVDVAGTVGKQVTPSSTRGVPTRSGSFDSWWRRQVMASALCDCQWQPATLVTPWEGDRVVAGVNMGAVLRHCGYRRMMHPIGVEGERAHLWVSERYDPAALVGDSATESGQVARVPPPVCSAVYYCMATTAFLLWRLDGKHIPGHYIEEKLATSFYRGPTGVGSTGVCPTHAGGGADERLLMIDIGVNNGEQIPTWFELFNHCGRATDYVLIEALDDMQGRIRDVTREYAASIATYKSKVHLVAGAVVNEDSHNRSLTFSQQLTSSRVVDSGGDSVDANDTTHGRRKEQKDVVVRGLGLVSVLRERGLVRGMELDRSIALLKIDCEGYDAGILLSIEPVLRKQLVELIIFERNAIADQSLTPVYRDAIKLLLGCRYRVFFVAISPWKRDGEQELFLVEVTSLQHFALFTERLEELVAFPAGSFSSVIGNELSRRAVSEFARRMMPRSTRNQPYSSCESYSPMFGSCLPKVYRMSCPRCGGGYERYSRTVASQQVPRITRSTMYDPTADTPSGRCSRIHRPRSHVKREEITRAYQQGQEG